MKSNLFKTSGFTLIELLIVLCIVGILTIFAYPQYQQHQQKLQRQDAITSLIKAQLILESCYAKNASYASDCEDLAVFPKKSDEGYYQINLDLNPTGYILIALRPEDSDCVRFSINEKNEKAAFSKSGQSHFACWRYS